MNLRQLLIFCMLILSKISFSQVPINLLKGKILEENDKPVEFALIKINQSTVFAEADSSGRFLLKIPETIHQIELIVSRIGFQTLSVKVDSVNSQKELVIYLKSTTSFEEVKKTAERPDYWKKQIKRFRKAFLGNNRYEKDCEILNPNDLILEVFSDGSLFVTFKDKLKIMNNATGYLIEIDIENFKVLKKGWNSGIKSLFFVEQNPKNESEAKKWKKHREFNFFDTPRGFLASIVHKKNLRKFSVYQENVDKNRACIHPYYSSVITEKNAGRLIKIKLDTLAKFDTKTNKFYINNPATLLIFSLANFTPMPVFKDSKNEFTYLTPINSKLIFDKYGNNLCKLQTIGYWSLGMGCAILLPKDYIPEKYLK